MPCKDCAGGPRRRCTGVLLRPGCWRLGQRWRSAPGASGCCGGRSICRTLRLRRRLTGPPPRRRASAARSGRKAALRRCPRLALPRHRPQRRSHPQPPRPHRCQVLRPSWRTRAASVRCSCGRAAAPAICSLRRAALKTAPSIRTLTCAPPSRPPACLFLLRGTAPRRRC